MAEYINRQALLRFLNDIWLTATPNDFMPDDDRHLAMVRCMGLNDAMDAVKSIHTADVVPVVRGKWIGYPECLIYTNAYSDDHIVCSACEECFSILDNDCERFNFCPNCGADMREAET